MHAIQRHRLSLVPVALLLIAVLLVSCASVEELIAAGDAHKAAGRHAQAYECYYNARHLDPHHPLVKARLGGKTRVLPGTNDPR